MTADEDEFEAWVAAEEADELSTQGIARQNGRMLQLYRNFRMAADAVAAAWRDRPEVAAIALIGSAARPPWKEVPRFRSYRRARIELWHECKDVDLALWLSDLSGLDALRRAKNAALNRLRQGTGCVASHQVDVFLLKPGSDRYLGRLCQFNRCPKGKIDCLLPGCGATPFLRQHAEFAWRPDSVAEGRMLVLFDRATGREGRAADLPLRDGEG
jgi:hypothetical protein